MSKMSELYEAKEIIERLHPKLPPRCADCGKYYADPPSDLCPGCEAYLMHTAL